MELSREQINKIMELADKTNVVDVDNITSVDISRALVEIERKLNFFDVDVNLNSANKNILIVDDLELSLYQLNQLMKKVGIRAFVARNKEEASAELIKHNFDFLLVDLFLPDCEDGFALIQEAIKIKDAGKQNYKIIVVSGADDKSLIDKCYNLGVDGYVTKSENWHTDIFKYINTTTSGNFNNVFTKIEVSPKIVSYSLKKFNDKKIFDALIADINSSIMAGLSNIILNLEKINIFEQDNTYILAEIYKICQNAGGSFLLVNPSVKIKEALASAYLEGIIPIFHTIDEVVNYVSELEKNEN